MSDADPTIPSPSDEAATKLHGLDPAELLARGLKTVPSPGGSGAWTPPTPDELAILLPQYRIESLLGHGGMGAVYKGRQPALDRPVAIKLLPAELASDRQFLARFQREARTLAKLQHPGIVAVHDFGQTGEGHLYFVMEFVDGTDLQRMLRPPGLNPAQALELVSQICDALHYAHQQGVMHRDIKPSNILVTAAGRVKIADFGLARPLRDDTEGLTQTNMVMGTPNYMAPEQRMGHSDHRADIFALGVMLYEMLTGQRPHGAFDLPSHKVQVDVRLDEVVVKALQQQPDRRYQHVSELKTDVDRIRSTPMQGAPKLAPKAKPTRHRWILVASAVCLAAILALVSWIVWKKPNQQSPEAAAPDAMAPRSQHPNATPRGGKAGTSRVLSAATVRDPQQVEFYGEEFTASKKDTVANPDWVLANLSLATKAHKEQSFFEGLVQFARKRMQSEKIKDAVDAGESPNSRFDREAHALAALLRIESDKVNGSKKIDDLPEIVLVPLLQYVTGSKNPLDLENLKQFRSSFVTTYTTNPSAKWVPERLPLGSLTLEQNPPIAAGLGRLRALAGESIRSQLESAGKIALMRDDLRKFREIERMMDATASGPGDPKAKEEKLTALLAQLGAVKAEFDAKLKTATSNGLMSTEKVSLSFAYQQLVSSSQSQSTANFQLLRDAVKPNLAHPTAKLFKEVDDELAKTLANLTEQLKGTFNDKDREELTQLDSYLSFGDPRLIYEVRYRIYQDAAEVATKMDKTDDLIGKQWAAYGAVVKEIQVQRGELPKIQLKLVHLVAKDIPSIENTCKILLDVAVERRLSSIAPEYLRQTKQKFDANFFEPYVSDTGRKLAMNKPEREATNKLIELWKLDRDSADFQEVDPVVKAKLTAFFSQLDAMKAAAAAYDDYWEKMNSLKARVTFISQNPYKWKTANGADIFNTNDYSFTVKFGDKVGITLKDSAIAPFDGSVIIDTSEEGPQTVRSGGATLKFEVKRLGQKPPPLSSLPKPPSKPTIGVNLR